VNPECCVQLNSLHQPSRQPLQRLVSLHTAHGRHANSAIGCITGWAMLGGKPNPKLKEACSYMTHKEATPEACTRSQGGPADWRYCRTQTRSHVAGADKGGAAPTPGLCETRTRRYNRQAQVLCKQFGFGPIGRRRAPLACCKCCGTARANPAHNQTNANSLMLPVELAASSVRCFWLQHTLETNWEPSTASVSSPVMGSALPNAWLMTGIGRAW
jgi:hypothetical protein